MNDFIFFEEFDTTSLKTVDRIFEEVDRMSLINSISKDYDSRKPITLELVDKQMKVKFGDQFSTIIPIRAKDGKELISIHPHFVTRAIQRKVNSNEIIETVQKSDKIIGDKDRRYIKDLNGRNIVVRCIRAKYYTVINKSEKTDPSISEVLNMFTDEELKFIQDKLKVKGIITESTSEDYLLNVFKVVEEITEKCEEDNFYTEENLTALSIYEKIIKHQPDIDEDEDLMKLRL